jgi:hypothetical protein
MTKRASVATTTREATIDRSQARRSTAGV